MSNVSYLLDTDIAGYLMRGRNATLDARIRHTPPNNNFVSVITQAEMLYGTKQLAQHAPRREEVLRFLHLAQIVDWNSAPRKPTQISGTACRFRLSRSVSST